MALPHQNRLGGLGAGLALLALPLLLVTSFFLGGCAASGGGAREESSGAVERLYRSRCGSCHEPYAREDHDADTWRAMVARYAPKAGLHGARREEVLAWLLEGARR